MTRDLILRLKYKYFEEIKDGIKDKEYRLIKDYWTKRLVGRTYDRVVVARGSLTWSNPDNLMFFPWNGYVIEEIVHPEFGNRPAKVYAILLRGEAHA